MDRHQQQKIDQAAEEFADAVRKSYQALAERSVSAQELNAELSQQFFDKVLENLRSQEEDNRQLTQQLVSHQERQQEAVQSLTQESVSAYMDFINSMFTYSKSGPQAAKRGTEEARKVT